MGKLDRIVLGEEKGHVAGARECSNESSGYHKMRGISWLADSRLHNQEGFCFTESAVCYGGPLSAGITRQSVLLKGPF